MPRKKVVKPLNHGPDVSVGAGLIRLHVIGWYHKKLPSKQLENGSKPLIGHAYSSEGPTSGHNMHYAK